MMTTLPSSIQFACALPSVPADLYQLHQQVAGLLSRHRADAGVKRGYVYRVIPYGEGVAMVARVRGDWTENLAAEVLAESTPLSCPIKAEGQQLTISLRCSPSVRHGSIEKPAPDTTAFVQALLQRHGLDAVTIQVSEPHRWPMHKKGLRRVLLRVIDATATVTVRDVAAAQRAWTHGVGRYKSFGLGLMLEH